MVLWTYHEAVGIPIIELEKDEQRLAQWPLHFGLILNLVPKLILLLGQSLILENRFYFGPCQ